MKQRHILKAALLGSLCVAGCTPEMNQFGSTILSSTGLVSGSQANAIFEAGSKLSKAAQSVTDEQEYYLGRAVAATILNRYKQYKNPSLEKYGTKIATVLASYSSRPETFGGYHVAFLDTPEVNAVSAPGGFIFISRGFLSKLKSEEELASVIGHEVGHIALRHGVSAISESNLTDALTIIGKEAAASSGNLAVSELNSLFGDSVNQMVNTLLDNGYSRGQEYDADEYASALLGQSGYNQKAMIRVLDELKAGSGQKGGWYDTHPSPDKREAELSDLAKLPDGPVAGEAKRTARFKKSA